MDEGNQPVPWQKLVDMHENQLKQHRYFLSTFQAEAPNVPGAEDFVKDCLVQSETMLKNFQQSADRYLVGNRQAPRYNSYVPEKMLPIGPRLDTSGLFRGDNIPTRGDELLSRPTTSPVIRTKRKVMETNEAMVSPPQSPQQPEEHPRKRVRREEALSTKDGQIPKNETSNEPIDDVPEKSIETPAASESFVQDVEELLWRKELQRLRKQEKKRKRDSGVSDVTMTEAAQIDLKPRKKKRKDAQTIAVDEAEVQTSSQTPSQSGRTTPQVEKGGNKRLSPASEYLASFLEQADGRRRSKRRNASYIG